MMIPRLEMNTSARFLHKNWELTLLFFIPLIIVIVWFHNGLIYGGSENGLPFYDLNKMVNLLYWGWNEIALGNTIVMGVSGLPLYATLALLHNLGIPAFILEAALYWLIFVIGGVSTYYLYKEIFPVSYRPTPIIVSLFYWFNPLSLIVSWNRNLLNFTMFSAFLPLFILLYLQGINRKSYSFIPLIALISGLFSYALSSTVFILILLGLILYITLFKVIFEDSTDKKFLISYAIYVVLFITLVNFFWLIHLFIFVNSPGYTQAVGSFFRPDDNLQSMTATSLSLGKLTNVFKLAHGTFYQVAPEWARMYLLPPVALLSYGLVGIILWTILRNTKNLKVLSLGLFFIINIYLVKGNNLPFGEVFELLFKKITFIQVFRNPFEKFGFTLSLVCALLFGAGYQSIAESNKKIKVVVTCLIVIVLVAIFGFPFWQGLVFTIQDKDNPAGWTTLEVQVPDYYKKANDWLKGQPGTFRFISLPLGGEGIKFKWDHPYNGVELSGTLFETSNVSFNTTIPFFFDIANELRKYQLNKQLLSFSAFLNAKYLLIREDIDFKGNQMASPQSVKQVVSSWVDEKLLSKVFESGKIALYKISDDFFWPKFYITSNIIQMNKPDFGLLAQYNSNLYEKPVVIIEPRNGTEISTPTVIKYKSKYVPIFPTAFKRYSDEEIMGKLFYAKHLPDSPLLWAIQAKEFLERPKATDYFGALLHDAGILGKRAAELYKLTKVGSDPQLINQARERYKVYLDNYLSRVPYLITSSGDVPSVIRESILLQHALIQRGDQETAKYLFDNLVRLKLTPNYYLPDGIGGKNIIYIFEITSRGIYQLNSETSLDSFEVYMDGKKISNTSSLFLDKGSHEIALSHLGNGLRQNLVSIDRLRASNSSNFMKQFIFLNKPSEYRLSLDYRFDSGYIAAVTVIQDIDQETSPVTYNLLNLNLGGGTDNWYHWETNFNSSIGASSGIIRILPFEKQECPAGQRQKIETCPFQLFPFNIDIKNLNLELIVYPELFLVGSPSQQVLPNPTTPTIIKWAKINPTLYRLKVHKTTAQKEYLVFSELYNAGWKIYKTSQSSDGLWLQNNLLETWRNQISEYKFLGEKNQPLATIGKSSVFEPSHIPVNHFANGWVIDSFGDYDLILEFSPQRYIYLGLIISGFACLICLGYILKKLYVINP